MNYKGITLLCVMMLLFSAIASFPVSAQAKDQDAGILIIYSTLDGKESSQVKMLDLLAGHFTSHVTVKKIQTLKRRISKERPCDLLRPNEKKAQPKIAVSYQRREKTGCRHWL